MNTLEQLVRQLEREVSALEKRSCVTCTANAAQPESEQELPLNSSHHGAVNVPTSARDNRKDALSDTESVGDVSAQHAHAQLSLLKEQLERAEAQLQVSFIL